MAKMPERDKIESCCAATAASTSFRMRSADATRNDFGGAGPPAVFPPAVSPPAVSPPAVNPPAAFPPAVFPPLVAAGNKIPGGTPVGVVAVACEFRRTGIAPTWKKTEQTRNKGWPLYDIVSINGVWCTVYKRDIGRGGGVVYCPIVVQWCCTRVGIAGGRGE